MFWQMNFFMTNYKILLLFFLILTPSCADWRVAMKAKKHGCNVPSTNYAFLEIAGIEPTGTTKDFTGYYKYFTYIFKKPFFDVEDRCRHSRIVVHALNENNDFKVFKWSNKNKKTSGKAVVTMTREYGRKICKDYYSFISKETKRYVYQGTACLGPHSSLSQKAIAFNDHWIFYPYKTNQSGGRPILESWGTLNDIDHPDIRKSKYKFHCTRTPWRCR